MLPAFDVKQREKFAGFVRKEHQPRMRIITIRNLN